MPNSTSFLVREIPYQHFRIHAGERTSGASAKRHHRQAQILFRVREASELYALSKFFADSVSWGMACVQILLSRALIACSMAASGAGIKRERRESQEGGDAHLRRSAIQPCVGNTSKQFTQPCIRMVRTKRHKTPGPGFAHQLGGIIHVFLAHIAIEL